MSLVQFLRHISAQIVLWICHPVICYVVTSLKEAWNKFLSFCSAVCHYCFWLVCFIFMAPRYTDDVVCWHGWEMVQTAFSTLRETHLFIFEDKDFYLFLLACLPVGIMFSVSVYSCSSTTLWADGKTFGNVCPSSWAAELKCSHTYTRSLDSSSD